MVKLVFAAITKVNVSFLIAIKKGYLRNVTDILSK